METATASSKPLYWPRGLITFTALAVILGNCAHNKPQSARF